MKDWVLRSAIICAALAPAAAAAQEAPESPQWAKMPRMQLQRQFAGPLQDTVIQRWRDPADGTICYIYLPIAAAHSVPTNSGFVQYGANTIGSISCFVDAAAPRHPTAAEKKRPPVER
jgi:hypothetical protein